MARVRDQAERVRENRLRRMAERQGLRFLKSYRRDPRALDFGKITLVDARTGETVVTATTDLDAIEAYLTGEVRNRETTTPEDDSAA